ncbi:hypothetical protein JCM24511_00104 [Saitozyma sp. JCM 24511]|nr:hypothetical protein JCM24511_00104 [Saitozyma sp. JCM 24511]
MSDQETVKRYETIASHFVGCSLAELHGLTQSDTRTGLRLFSHDQSNNGIQLAKIWAGEYNSLPHTMNDSERHVIATRATSSRLLSDDDDRVAKEQSPAWYLSQIKASQDASLRAEQSKGGEMSFFQRCSTRLWETIDPALLDSLPEPSPALRAQFLASSLAEAEVRARTAPE